MLTGGFEGLVVGLAGLEPATFRPPDGRATRLRYSPNWDFHKDFGDRSKGEMPELSGETNIYRRGVTRRDQGALVTSVRGPTGMPTRRDPPHQAPRASGVPPNW